MRYLRRNLTESRTPEPQWASPRPVIPASVSIRIRSHSKLPCITEVEMRVIRRGAVRLGTSGSAVRKCEAPVHGGELLTVHDAILGHSDLGGVCGQHVLEGGFPVRVRLLSVEDHPRKLIVHVLVA